jgi:hypothetical protein
MNPGLKPVHENEHRVNAPVDSGNNSDHGKDARKYVNAEPAGRENLTCCHIIFRGRICQLLIALMVVFTRIYWVPSGISSTI